MEAHSFILSVTGIFFFAFTGQALRSSREAWDWPSDLSDLAERVDTLSAKDLQTSKGAPFHYRAPVKDPATGFDRKELVQATDLSFSFGSW